ncbi:MAG: helix-turn-helix domain-containing protein [Bacteroidota bacterium]
MQTYNLPPISPLRHILKSVWVVDYGKIGGQERMIPFGCMDMVYVERGELFYKNGSLKSFSQQDIFLTGQVSKPYDFIYGPNVCIIGFGFYPHTAHLFTKVASHQLTNSINQLSDLFDKKYSWGKLHTPMSLEEKAALLQQFILEKIEKNRISEPKQEYLRYLLKGIFQSEGAFNLSKAQTELNISPRYIQRLFKEYIGINPLLYARIVRFLNAIDKYEPSKDCLTGLALDCGYYDQSHFIRDFKAFTGLTPRQYFYQPPNLTEQFTQNEAGSLLYNSIPDA